MFNFDWQWRIGWVGICMLMVTACAHQPKVVDHQQDEDVKQNRDPWENYNRKVFAFNLTLDKYFLKPMAQSYAFVLPSFMERGVNNVFDNLGEAGNSVNNVLQGKWKKMAQSSGRLVVNSTLGLAGLMDVAKHVGLDKQDPETFGQTLSYWGLPSGPYVLIPFLPPTTLADLAAKPVDLALDPSNYGENEGAKFAKESVALIASRAKYLEAEKLMTGDKYTFIREAFLQRRNYLVNDGKVEDDFGGDIDFEEDAGPSEEDNSPSDDAQPAQP